ncbi:RNA polymerase sigma factor [Gimesia aquarii]|uniref:RNA polymerase sigma factor n=1 Tax=Gimesia aquarii TaxID=2527964 RepID=A0A517VV29_9PLAN|nr:sigma-70 family RNA polymerase sigma factor [Gimesia aquarii]QDT96864.1 ECF RNA polymerase sigma factor SigW [Gimesia aquarii]
MKSINSNDLKEITDAKLIQLSGQGDQNAYGQIVERYQSLVCSVAYNRCGNLAQSEDLAQDAFILAWQKLSDLKDISKFKAWICTIVRNLANRSSQRPGRSVTRATHLDAVPDIPAETESPSERAVSVEEEKLAWQALADIPETYREPLVLFYREEQSVARVAEALDLSEDAVKQRLSRGRKMVQQHLAAVVASALSDSKPTKLFTGAVLLGLSGAVTKPAAAAGVTTATTTVAKTVTDTVVKSAVGAGAASGWSSLFLGPLLNLPVIAWLTKLAVDETRSERERELLRRGFLFAFCGLLALIAALVSSIWWQQYIEPPSLRAMIPATMMVLFLIPWVLYCRKMGKQIERIRKEEGIDTPLRPLIESGQNGSIVFKIFGVFCLSALLVMTIPAILPLIAKDWLILAVMAISAICVSFIAAQLSQRFPKYSFQLYGTSNGVTALIAIGIVFWRWNVWQPSFANFMLWFVSVISAVNLVSIILTTIAWKRVYGKPKSSGGKI